MSSQQDGFRLLIHRLKDRLTRIKRPLSPHLEAASVAWNRGPVLLENVDGHQVALNLVSKAILAESLGVGQTELVKHLSTLNPAQGEIRIVEDPPALEVEEKPDLGRLPVLTYHPGDAGPYITAGVVIAGYQGVLNASIHRLMVLDRTRLVARIVEGRHTHNLYTKASNQGKPLPIAIAIGLDPRILLAFCTHVPPGQELNYASTLLQSPLEVFKTPNNLLSPHCEILLTGYIHPTETAQEGPLLDLTGTYQDTPRRQPVIHITGYHHRRNPVYHAIIPASQEHRTLLGLPYEPLIYQAASKVAKIRDVHLTEGGCHYFHAAIQIEKQKDTEPQKVAEAAFKAHKGLKHAIIVDPDIDITNPTELEYAIATRVKADRDIYIYPKKPGSPLDPTRENGLVTKIAIDATTKQKPGRISAETTPPTTG